MVDSAVVEMNAVDMENKKTKKKYKRTKNIVELVEITTNDKYETVFIKLPLPEDLVKSVDKGLRLNRENIMRAVARSAEKGDTRYDHKNLAVISYQPPKKLVPETVRKARFQSEDQSEGL